MGSASCSCVQKEAEPSTVEPNIAPSVSLVYHDRLSCTSKESEASSKSTGRLKAEKPKSFEARPDVAQEIVNSSPFAPLADADAHKEAAIPMPLETVDHSDTRKETTDLAPLASETADPGGTRDYAGTRKVTMDSVPHPSGTADHAAIPNGTLDSADKEEALLRASLGASESQDLKHQRVRETVGLVENAMETCAQPTSDLPKRSKNNFRLKHFIFSNIPSKSIL